MKDTKQNFVSVFPLILILFNAIFLLQLVFGYFPEFTNIEQWVIIVGNFVLLTFGILSVQRKKPKHFSKKDPTLFQLFFFILLIVHAVLLLILIVSKPIIFLIFMPFEFFVIAFYVGFYFLITRHIFLVKQ